VVVIAKPGEPVLAPEVPTPAVPKSAAKSERESVNAAEPWRLKAPKATAAKPLALPAAQSFTLPNGLTVIHSEKPGLPLASAALVLRAGQAANPADRAGLASFTAAMLLEGSTQRSAQQIADEAAQLGIALNSGAGAETARIEISGLKSSFAQGLALLADVSLNPAFTPAEVERQRAQRLAALAQQREDAEGLAVKVANRVLYGDGHPLGADGLGDEASIKATDAAALRQFWQQRYRPDQAALVVAGDVSAAELRALAERLFGAWAASPQAVAPTPLPPARPVAARTVLVDKPGAPQTALAIVGVGPRAGVPDEPAIQVMNAGLGGLFTSRLNTQLREVKGYTYGVFSGFSMGRERGAFSIRGSVRTDVTGPALLDTWKEINALRAKPMGAEELKRVRNAQLLSLPGSVDTNLAVMGAYAANWSLGLGLDHLVQAPARLAAVSAADALKAARQYVKPQDLIVVAVGDPAKVLPQLAAIRRTGVQLRQPDGELPAKK
jgi:zinc protease